MMTSNVGEKQVIESMKQEKMEGDLNLVRNLVQQFDKRLIEESQSRTRALDEQRNFFEQKS